MAYKETVEIIAWLVKRVDQVSKFIKKKVRRDDVKNIKDAIRNRNARHISKRLRKLHRKVEARRNSE